MLAFVADLHLLPNDNKSQLFINFCKQTNANQLYILGDLFEVWLGDDVSINLYQSIISALNALSKRCAIYLMIGNRDFLIGQVFARQSGVNLIDEPYILTTTKQQYLLMHGDKLCSDDTQYQLFRSIVRNKLIRWFLLNLPNSYRSTLAMKMRHKSQRYNAKKALYKLDVNIITTNKLMANYPSADLIHGHTHKQAIHNEHKYKRFVLGDWSDNKGNVLIVEAEKIPYFIQI